MKRRKRCYQKSMARKRPSSSEALGGACEPKRRSGCHRDQENSLKDLMAKLEPSELLLVQQLCQKYHITFPQLSPRIPTFRLHFKNKLPDILFTERKIKAENHMELEIVIVDASNKVIKYGHLASAEIKIVVLDGDFDGDENDEWTKKEFEKHVIDARKDKRPLLIGNLHIKLCEGVGYISDVKFTDNSSWRKSKMFRLGLKIDGQTGIVGEVQEGISNAFRVKDRHVEIIQKDHPPSMNDEVCCLKGIFKNGAFHKKLVELKIKTVQDFLCYCSNNNPEMLCTMIGMSKGAWKKTMGHARESKGEPYNLLNGLVSLPAPDQDSFEITGLNSSQALNAPPYEHNGVQHSTCSIECEPQILNMSLPDPNTRFPPRNSFKAIHITRDGAWKGTERLDISWEVLMEGSGISMSNKFNNGVPSSPSKWGMLVFVARWKTVLRSKKKKYFATSSTYNNEPIWEYLSPIETLTP